MLQRRFYLVFALVLISYPLPWGGSITAEEATEHSARRALVVGIDDYLPPGADPAIVAARQLRSLGGAVRDARILTALLRDPAHGFEVMTLINGAATRKAILRSLVEHLEKPARPGDEIVFYFAGHGSRRRSSDLKEFGWDETLVPADAALGAADLLDDELRRHLHRVLARGARLTVILDACYSGSAVRGLPVPRSARYAAPGSVPSPRRADQVPSLETGDALILAAAQDFQPAFETTAAEGQIHGAFSHALWRALGQAAAQEEALDTFRRARALLRADGGLQEPVITGPLQRLESPLFAPTRKRGVGDHSITAVVLGLGEGGDVLLDGGWAQGLRRGGELLRHDGARLQLLMADPVRSRGRLLTPGTSVAVGDVFTLVRWGLPSVPDLVVWMPQALATRAELRELAAEVERRVVCAGRRLVEDPLQEAPSHVMRFRPQTGWELVGRGGYTKRLGQRLETKVLDDTLAELSANARLFLQLPLAAEVVSHIELGEGSKHDAIVFSDAPESAHYQLVGYVSDGVLNYAWMRPGVDRTSLSALPPATRLVFSTEVRHMGQKLTRLAVHLARIRFWLTLPSPANPGYPYRLALRSSDGELLRSSEFPTHDEFPPLTVGAHRGLALWTDDPFPVRGRYTYVVLLDAAGERQLYFPSVRHTLENYLPRASMDDAPAPTVIPIGRQPDFEVQGPPGLDTWILLTTSEPLPNPNVLRGRGVRDPGDHPLARLFHDHHLGRRGGDQATSLEWSVDRLTVRVVAGEQ